jgi:hypothetical protein
MLHAISWFVVASLAAIWSFLAWAFHAVSLWAVSNADSLSGIAAQGSAVSLPAWLAPWVPPELATSVLAMLASLGPMLASLLQSLPGLSSSVTVAAWLVWGIGFVLILLLGAGLHLLISMWRRRPGVNAIVAPRTWPQPR